MKRNRLMLLYLLLLVLVISGCGSQDAKRDGELSSPVSYHQITQDEAKAMMQQDDGHVIVDVRRQDEYDAGHIPGAILIPNESIGTEQPEELPVLQQIILVYCRSGRRSKEASQKLADMGYANVYEFGGILDWTGDIVSEETEQESQSKEDNQGQSIAMEAEESKMQSMRLFIGDTEVPVVWEENESVQALRELLPLTISMSMYGGFEQVGAIGQSIVRNDVQITTDYGDIVLYSGNQIVVFYGSNSWSYTLLGHIDLTQKELTNLLGQEAVTVTISE